VNNTIKFTKSTSRPAIWTSNLFPIDDNLIIKFALFRSTEEHRRVTNHIWYIEFSSFDNKIIDKCEDVQMLEETTNIVLDKLCLNKFKKPLYLLTINSIILKIIFTKFDNSEQEKVIDVSNIKEILKNNAIFNGTLMQIATGDNKNLIEDFAKNNVDLATIIKNKLNCEIFKKIIDDYKMKLSENNDEESWQKFFTENNMILSFLAPIPIVFKANKAYVGGKTIENTHGNLVDFIYKNKFTNNSCIIEIKAPDTKLFKTGQYRREHIHNMSDDLIGGINQLINYKNSFTKEYNDLIANDPNRDFECWNVKTILIIGNTKEFTENHDKLRQFELFRNSINDIIIITFDELLEKLEGILNIITSK